MPSCCSALPSYLSNVRFPFCHTSCHQRNITTVEQFAALADSDRKQIVRSLSDEEYSDIIAVFAGFPYVEVEAESHGKSLFIKHACVMDALLQLKMMKMITRSRLVLGSP